MDDKRYTFTTRREVLAVPIGDAEALLRESDGNAALLYLYTLKGGGEFESVVKAAADLKRTEREISDAAARLGAMGVLTGADAAAGVKLPPADQIPEYPAEEIARRANDKGEFGAVIAETQRLMGRLLSASELKTLLGIYDYLSLPAEVILMLVNHCVEEYRETMGDGRLPSMRRIEKEAYHWANNEIYTLERAEDYIRDSKHRREAGERIKNVLQIRGRPLSSTERKYVDGWIAMGFDADALEIAYDKTVVKTGGMQWKYMDTIVKSWHGKGLHTPDEILKGDLPPYKRTGAGGKLAGSKARDTVSPPRKGESERMKKVLEKLSNG